MRVHLMIWMLIVGLAAGFSAMAQAPKKAAKAAKATKDGPKEVVLKSCQKTKPPVAFPHEAHVKKGKLDCKTCHHTGENKACTSSGCHGPKAEGKKLGCAEMSMTKNPYHVNCAGCHKKLNKGPKTCVACHKK